jgi:ArsR family transcriptional regulator, virulence genes transcriptional regulator
MGPISQTRFDVMNLQDMLRNSAKAVELLKAVSNERRLLILCHLLDGEMSVGEMNEKLALSQSALSQHLALLRAHKLVKTRKAAQTVFYSLDSDEAEALITLLHKLYCSDDPK